MDIRISGYGDNAVLELPPYSVGQTKSHVAVRQISTYTLIDYNGNYGTEVVLISGQRVLAGCWPEDLSKAMTVATRIYETVDIPIPDEVVDLKLLLKSQQECDRLRAEVEALRKCCTRRGARMQKMFYWINSTGTFAAIPHEFISWFDVDGVPVKDDITATVKDSLTVQDLRGEGEQ